ncbi:unnamed protein product [Notodromas monacha]|uniref:Uncharacterized protein n=1 Tax=Notodromas monacha TaxID=399045 RepID=A0A7R9BP24_9CRUS|nr:unnamed protein product [Notodromas monacha]CAG0919032.1 unnamed protein product [Notodromas monacha]
MQCTHSHQANHTTLTKYMQQNQYKLTCSSTELKLLDMIGRHFTYDRSKPFSGNKTHTLCRRCGKSSYHIQKHRCAQCGYPSARLRHYNWSVKAQRRKTTGTGRMRHLKIVHRRFKNGFKEPNFRKAIKGSKKAANSRLIMSRQQRLLKPMRGGHVRRAVHTPLIRDNRRNPSPISTDSGLSNEGQMKADRKLVPTLHEITVHVDQASSCIEKDFLDFVQAARAKIVDLKREKDSLKRQNARIQQLEQEVGMYKRQVNEGRPRDLKGIVQKVGSYCSRTGTDPRSISECSSDDIPRQKLNDMVGKLVAMERIEERRGRNSTSDSILLSGEESNSLEQSGPYNLRQREGRSSRSRRSRSANLNRSRSRSRPRPKRRSSVEPNEKRFVASTTVHFNAATGEPVQATATLSQSRPKRRSDEAAGGDVKKVKTITMDLEKAAELVSKLLGFQQVQATLAKTPAMSRIYSSADSPPSSACKSDVIEHQFYPKNPSWMKAQHCQVCAKPLKMRSSLKCSACSGVCHETCRGSMPVPCIECPPENNKYHLDDLRAFVPERTPMIPALLVHCVNEIEKRGFNELGLYRVNGSKSKVEELYEKYVSGLKGNGYPPLCEQEISVLCSVLKLFFKKLKDTLIPVQLHQSFFDVCSDASPGQTPEGLFTLVRSLPRANRDTLTYLILHLKRVANEDAVKMPIANLAKVFAPTIVGSPDMNSVRKAVSVMEVLLNAPDSFFNDVLHEGIAGSCLRSTSTLGPLSTLPRVRQLQATPGSMAKSRIFTSPYLID